MFKALKVGVVLGGTLLLANCAPHLNDVDQNKYTIMGLHSEARLFSSEASENNRIYDAAFAYHHGLGVVPDHMKAKDLYLEAIRKHDDTRAMNELGVMLLTSEYVVPHSVVDGLQYVVDAANSGNSSARFNLGLFHLHGFHVKKDSKSAIEMITASAKQGNLPAQSFLVSLVLENKAALRDYPEIKNSALALVDQGYIEYWEIASRKTQYSRMWSRFFSMNLKDRSILKSDVLALASSCHECHDLNLQVVSRKLAEIETVRKNARAGDLNAMYLLGLWYQTGNGVPKNEAEGARWIVKSADAGYVPAQYALGETFLNGTGIKKNYAMAYAWFLLVATSDRGYKEEYWARENLDWMETYFAKSDRVVGRDFARNWVKNSKFYE